MLYHELIRRRLHACVAMALETGTPVVVLPKSSCRSDGTLYPVLSSPRLNHIEPSG